MTDPTDDQTGSPDQGEHRYQGRCHGGPWDTSDADVRYPGGFLLIHKPERAVWIYDRQDDGSFRVRSATPEPLDDAKRQAAMDGDQYDIRVLDPVSVEPASEVAP